MLKTLSGLELTKKPNLYKNNKLKKNWYQLQRKWVLYNFLNETLYKEDTLNYKKFKNTHRKKITDLDLNFMLDYLFKYNYPVQQKITKPLFN